MEHKLISKDIKMKNLKIKDETIKEIFITLRDVTTVTVASAISMQSINVVINRIKSI